ncbi:MAG: ABC transporter permease [Acidobacteriia bacterium]|nr:ABC transporter permease [Terriglobia bacterium]
MDAELGRELALHFEQLVQEHTGDGMTRAEARRAARRAFGNLATLEDECRDHRRVAWLHDLRQDVVYGLRMLRKSPGFTAIAVTSLALGIGGNAAILGVADAVLRASLPFPDASRVAIVRSAPAENPFQNNNASGAESLTWKRQTSAFESMGISLNEQRDFGPDSEGTPAERIAGQAASWELFRTLGVQPMLGRVFTEAEDSGGQPAAVLVISHRLWQRRFGSDPHIVGRRVPVNGNATSIIGVMPMGFQYPTEHEDYWAPLSARQRAMAEATPFFLVTARLRRGVSADQAQSMLDAAARQIRNRDRGRGAQVLPLRKAWFGWLAEPLYTLEAAVGLILLIACANVAGLLLARGAARRPEMALRVALGAGRGRIFRQLLTESLLLSLGGGVWGVLVAWEALHSLPALTPPPGLPHLTAGLDARALALTGMLSVATGLAFGLAPALAAFHLDLNQSLKESVPSLGLGWRRPRFRGALVTVQIALAFVLLIGAGLLNRSFLRMVGRDLHFDPHGLLTFEIHLPGQRYQHDLGTDHGVPLVEFDPPPSQAISRVYDRLQNLTGAESVAGVSFRPVNSFILPSVTAILEGRPAPENDAERRVRSAAYFLVTPNFFATMKSPLLQGREIAPSDTVERPWVAIVNETAARRFWPGQNPIGQHFTLDTGSQERPREVVGVAPDIPLRRIETGPRPVIYTSYAQQPARYRGRSANMFGQMTFVLRTSGDPRSLLAAARQAVSEVEPDLPLARVATIERILDGRIREQRDYAWAAGIFALAAAVLAAIGIYGVMAYAVARQTREIGIRMALGAEARHIVRFVGRPVALPITAGLALGLAGSLALTRLIASQLWGTAPTDPATFMAVSLLFLAVALLACFLPARRAFQVDPARTLRNE